MGFETHEGTLGFLSILLGSLDRAHTADDVSFRVLEGAGAMGLVDR